MMKLLLDYEYYPRYFPRQIKDVRIVEKYGNTTITEEHLIFSTLLKNEIIQKSMHVKVSEDHIMTKILEGHAKDTTVDILISEINSGIQLEFNISLKLSLKSRFLEPFIKKLYKRYLTSLVLKMGNRGILNENY